MLSREQAITQLKAYGVSFSEEQWHSETARKDGEFGVFAIIIRIIAGLFILGMVSISIAGFIALIGQEANWQTVTGIIGILATGFAGWKFRHSYKTLEKQYSFKGLLYLSLLLVGKACLLAALFGWFDGGFWLNGNVLAVAIAFSVITLVSCFYYRMYLESFLAVLVCLFLLDKALGITILSLLVRSDEGVSSAFGDTYYVIYPNLVLTHDIISAGVLTVSAACLLWVQQKRYLSSVYFYAVILFFAYKLFPMEKVWRADIASLSDQGLPVNWGLSLIAFVAAFWLYTFLVGGWQKLKSVQHLIVIVGIAILAALSVHGVLLAVALMAMGHVRHDKVLWVIGLIYLPLYLIAFYYTLDATLLVKSYMLLASGIAILLARYALVRFVGPKNAEADHA